MEEEKSKDKERRKQWDLMQNEVKEQADEYGSEGKALLAIVKANPDKYKIDYQSKDSPFL